MRAEAETGEEPPRIVLETQFDKETWSALHFITLEGGGAGIGVGVVRATSFTATGSTGVAATATARASTAIMDLNCILDECWAFCKTWFEKSGGMRKLIVGLDCWWDFVVGSEGEEEKDMMDEDSVYIVLGS